MNRFPVLERLIVSDYRLYPGTKDKPGIDFSFQTGVSLLAGINGLGKTTLINMLFRLIVGPFDLPKDSSSAKFGSAAKVKETLWSGRNSFFSQRVPDRAKDAWAELHFSIGDLKFVVRRALANLRLLKCSCDGEDLVLSLDEATYRAALCSASEAGQFIDFLTAVKYLSFFNEERRDILWDEQAQRQFFRILFTRPDEARDWIKAEQEISSADSRARNISATAYQYEEDLKKGERLLISSAGVDAKLAAEQAVLDADLLRKRELEGQAAHLESELKVLRRDLERSKLFEDSARRSLEEIRFSRLGRLFPSMPETAQYILTQLFADGRCLACEQDAPIAQQALQAALEANLCVVCGSGLNSSLRLAGSEALDASDVALNDARHRVAAANLQVEALRVEERERDGEWRSVLTELARVTAAANTRIKDVVALRSQLPPDPEKLSKLRSSIAELRERENVEKERRQGAEAVYEQLLSRVSERIEAATTRVSTIFQALIERFLEENCSLKFFTIEDRPSQSGRMFRYPSLRFEMTSAAFEGQQVRDTPDDVSESQREFIDLAFRMALSEAAAIDGAISMVIETPEASLDVIFMARAADMLRKFAVAPCSIIVTSNLTSSVMIPALMGEKTSDTAILSQRRERVLNLLDVAAPNAAVRLHHKQYGEFLLDGLKGLDA